MGGGRDRRRPFGHVVPKGGHSRSAPTAIGLGVDDVGSTRHLDDEAEAPPNDEACQDKDAEQDTAGDVDARDRAE